jgi:hypothetical protein
VKSVEGETTTPSRRQFGKRVALLAAAPLPVPALAAQDKPKDKPVPVAVTEALVEAVRARHGKHLSKKQLEQLALSILRSQFAAERLRKFKLSNADEPAFTFRADLP